ncbi:MAG: DUF2786 domain-containing protein [Actinomycetota bacterium]|nr:DUF2786 domain-containing protein [Actinomycetota bacterium]
MTALEHQGLRPLIDQALGSWAERGLDRAWASGWQPADVVRALRRNLSGAHAATLVPLLVTSAANQREMATDERWAAQVEDIRGESGSGAAQDEAELWLAVEALSLLLHLPPLPGLSSGSGSHFRADGRAGVVLARVRALLAKAESTTFPEEAEALTAKAQELMTRHSVDQAMLEANGHGRSTEVVGWRIGIDDPYATAKSVLLNHIAGASGCRAVWSKNMGFSTVFGAPDDLEMVELLFTSLLVQATDAMTRTGRVSDSSGRSRTRSFRQSFLLAYAARIGERLSETSARVVAEESARHGNHLLPALARRDQAVDEAVRAAFPDLGRHAAAISNYSGWVAGRAAAEVASLSVGEQLAAG